jgi:hypothetical protein
MFSVSDRDRIRDYVLELAVSDVRVVSGETDPIAKRDCDLHCLSHAIQNSIHLLLLGGWPAPWTSPDHPPRL